VGTHKVADASSVNVPLVISLDRIHNDGDYEPSNLRWAPQSTQKFNSRRSKLDKYLNALILGCIDKSPRRRRQICAVVGYKSAMIALL
jgi:hypothetical protein